MMPFMHRIRKHSFNPSEQLLLVPKLQLGNQEELE
jgi:hypothetical protein